MDEKQLAQVRISVNRESGHVEIVVNDRKITNAVGYRISQIAGDEVPRVDLELACISGVDWMARVARVSVETNCPYCGFTHRQATLPIGETDHDTLQGVLYALKYANDRSETHGQPDWPWDEEIKYVESLIRDVRASLDAFSPVHRAETYGPDHAALLTSAVENEVQQGRPDGDIETGAAGVDVARAALEGQRSRSGEEGTAVDGHQADDSRSRPFGGGNRAGEEGNSRLAGDEWPPHYSSFSEEDPED